VFGPTQPSTAGLSTRTTSGRSTSSSTREALAMEVDRSVGADPLVGIIEALTATLGAPKYLRMNNGPELLAWVLPDWCRFSGVGTHLH